MEVIFQVMTGSGTTVCLSLRNAAIVSFASLLTIIASFSSCKTILPVEGHVCIGIGKWKTSVRGPEITQVLSLTCTRQGKHSYLSPALRRLMLISARADRARAPWPKSDKSLRVQTFDFVHAIIASTIFGKGNVYIFNITSSQDVFKSVSKDLAVKI